jgi:hypothetical protein
MNESAESFRKDLDQLIRLFKKMKEKSGQNQFSHIDPVFTQNIDFIINNYEMVKNNVPVDMLNRMGFPFQTMLHQFIDQLKEELGEEDLPVEEKPKLTISHNEDITKIDLLLKKPGLTEDEINELLDQRNRLLNNG